MLYSITASSYQMPMVGSRLFPNKTGMVRKLSSQHQRRTASKHEMYWPHLAKVSKGKKEIFRALCRKRQETHHRVRIPTGEISKHAHSRRILRRGGQCSSFQREIEMLMTYTTAEILSTWQPPRLSGGVFLATLVLVSSRTGPNVTRMSSAALGHAPRARSSLACTIFCRTDGYENHGGTCGVDTDG